MAQADIEDDSPAIDPIDNEPLMAAIGRVAVRSNELGDMLQLIIRYVAGAERAAESRGKALGETIAAAEKAARGRLAKPGIAGAIRKLSR